MTYEGARISGRPRRLAIAAMVALLAYPVAGCNGDSAVTRPADAASALQLSLEHYQAGRYQDAITAAEAALAADPNSGEAYNNMAVAYLGLRKYDEATRAAEEAIRLNPDLQLAENNLKWIQEEKARADSAPVQAASPSEVGNLLDQSLQHSRSGRFQECIDTATQAMQWDPNSAAAFNNIGFCAANLQLWDEAIRNTQEAIRLDPTSQLAKNNLAWMQQERLEAGR